MDADRQAAGGAAAAAPPPPPPSEAVPGAMIPRSPRRLRCVAQYKSFRPQAMACSGPVLLTSPYASASSTSTTTTFTSSFGGAGRNGSSNFTDESLAGLSVGMTASSSSCAASSSLGAVAGSQGVAVFASHQPQHPRLVLSLASTTSDSSSAGSLTSSMTATNQNYSTMRSAGTAAGMISSLVFQPVVPTFDAADAPWPSASSSSSQLYLAAARGDGVLVWDVSGHSLSPLWGRWSTSEGRTGGGGGGRGSIGGSPATMMPSHQEDELGSATWASSSSSSPTAITSLCWHSAWGGGGGGSGGVRRQASDRFDCLIATTSTHACLWDVRQPPSSFFGTGGGSTFGSPGVGGSGSGAAAAPAGTGMTSSPALRFAHGATMGDTRTSDQRRGSSSLVQAACQGHFCAVLNRAGFLHVFDTRMVTAAVTSSKNRSAASGGAVEVVPAFHHAGVGLTSYVPSNTSSSSSSAATSWVAWGIDSPSGTTDAVVKVWSIGDNQAAACPPATSSDEYWYMDSSSRAVGLGTSSYRLVGSCTVPNLCCARVGPAPFQDAILTVGLESSDDDPSGRWKAQVWKVSRSEEGDTSATRLESVVAFGGGSDANDDSGISLPRIVDNASMGRLCASELAAVVTVRQQQNRDRTTQRTGAGVVASSTAASGAADDDDDEDGGSPARQAVLLLCSLTDAGYVTTHEIPEVDPSSLFLSHKRDSGTSRHASNALPHFGIAREALRVFPANKDVPVGDPAMAWVGEPAGGSTVGQSTATSQQLQLGEPANGLTEAKLPPVMDGGPPLPFDMEFSTFSAAPKVDDKAAVAVLPESTLQDADTVQAAIVARDAADLMQRIETDRIPCPRLCGATFGQGIGGLVTFNNGDIRRMWNWWERMDPARSAVSSAPGIIGELLLADEADTATSYMKRDCPRTLKDLNDMTIAAKESQWGDHDESEASSAGFHAPGPSFFEDASDGSTESGDDDLDDKDDMYETYFGDSHRPLLEGSTPNRDAAENQSSGKKASEQFGPSSDSLAPVVNLTRRFDALALSSQRFELAKSWKLGSIAEVVAVRSDIQPKKESSRTSKEDATKPPSWSRQAATGGLPRYRFLVPPSQPSDRFQRATSDPLLNSGLKPVGMDADDEDRGVHGGDYGVRPNMQESMVFLRKLFTHQQDGGSSFPSLFSPPDGPMLPNTRSDPAVTMMSASPYTVKTPPLSDASIGRNGRKRSDERLGLYTLQASDEERGNLPRNTWKDVEHTCEHNALVCEALGEEAKCSVWKLLAKAVAIRADDAGTNSFGPFAGGGFALGRKLVANLLQYYEALGDSQMLSTIVCVLRTGPAVPESSSGVGLTQHWSLLPQGQSDKFDTYIRRYADVLFAWGLLTTRAELNKHLASIPRDFDVEYAKGLGTAISVVPSFVCPRCSQETAGSSFCEKCNMFALRCVICDNSVRGLFTSCASCGHGGHTAHLQQWFANHDECPTGCGCVCALRAGGPTLPPPSTVSRAAKESSLLDADRTATGGTYDDSVPSLLDALPPSAKLFV